MPRHTIFLSEEVARRVAFDPTEDRGFSARISYLCIVATDLLKAATPVFTENEWMAILDISNGSHSIYDGRSTADFAESFSFSISESGPECNEKWSIKCSALSAKYRSLPLASQLATIEVCRRFWVAPQEINNGFESLKDALLHHGAKFQV